MKKIIMFFYRQIQLFRGYKSFGINSAIIPWGTRVWNKQCISLGNNSSIGKSSSLLITTGHNGNKYNPKVIIGNNVCIGNELFLACIDSITIEDNVLFSDRVFISDHIHDFADINKPILYQDLKKKGKVLVKEGAFVGINTIIHPGVTIGKNAVIGASSVVIKDIPDYSVATGNPAKVIKKYDFEKKEWVKI